MHTYYSHRPDSGVSVGVRSGQVDGDNILYIAFAIANDGYSQKGFLMPERRDQFSRKIGRAIINGRIDSMQSENACSSQCEMRIYHDATAGEFIAAFRRMFDDGEHDLRTARYNGDIVDVLRQTVRDTMVSLVVTQ